MKNIVAPIGVLGRFWKTLFAAGVALSTFAWHPANAVTSTNEYWNAGSGSWNTNTNWSTTNTGSTPPAAAPGTTNGTNWDVVFGDQTTTNVSTTLDTNTIINNLTFTTTNTVSIASGAGGSLTLNAALGAAYGIDIAGGAGAVTISAPVVLGANQTWINASSNVLTIGGPVSGGFGITTSNTGTIDLTGVNTFTGGLAIGTNSTLEIGGAGSLGASASYAGAISIASNATFEYASTLNQAITTGITGAGALTMGGTGTLTLSGNDTLTGPITVSAGTLSFTELDGFNAANAISIGTNATLTYDNTPTQILTGAISGSGTLENAGTGVLQIGNGTTGSLSSSINTTVSAGQLKFNMANGTTYNGNITLGTVGNFYGFENAGVTNTFGGVITGSATSYDFSQTGAGTTILTGTDTVTRVEIASGTLQIGNGATGALTAASGIANYGSNTTLAVDLANGGTFNTSITDEQSETGFTIEFLQSGTNTFSSGITQFAPITFIQTGGGTTILTQAANAIAFVSTLIQDGTVQDNSGTFTFGNNVVLGSGTNSGVLVLGNGSSTVSTAVFGLTTLGTGTANAVVGGGTATATLTVDLANGSVDTFGGTLGGGGTNQNNLALTLNGPASMLVLTGTDTYIGATTVTAGTLQIGNGTTGSISSSSASTVAPGGTLVFDEGNGGSYGGAINGTYGGIILGAEISGNTNTLGGVISGTNIAFTQAGPGTTILTGANTYTGATTVNAGTLQVGNGVTGSLNANTTLQIGSGAFTYDGTNAATQQVNGLILTGGFATVDVANGALNLGNITNPAAGQVDFSATGVTTTVSAANGIIGPYAYVGTGTSLSYATVSGTNIVAYTGATVDATGALGDVTSPTTNYSYSGTTINLGANQTGYTLQNTTSGTSQINLGADSLSLNGLLNSGSGLLTISGTTGGLVTPTGGTLDIADDGNGIVISADVTGSGGLAYGTPGAGVLTLSGSNSYTGGTTVNDGTVQLTGSLSPGTSLTVNNTGIFELGSGAGAVNTTVAALNGVGAVEGGNSSISTLTVAPAGTDIFGGSIGDNSLTNPNADNLALTVSGPGTLDLTGQNYYTGATTITTGTLELGGAGTMGGGSYAGAIAIGANAVFNDAGSGNQTLSGVISGAGGLTLGGAGTLILTTNETYTGATTVNNIGTLQVGNGVTGSINSASALQVGEDGAFTYDGAALSTQTVNSLTVNTGWGTVNNATTNSTLALGAITSTNNGMVDFNPTGLGAITTSTTNNATGILGTYAVYGTGTSTYYATSTNGGTIVAYTGATTATAGTLANMTSATTNYTLATTGTTATASVLVGNTLRYTGLEAVEYLGGSLTLSGLMEAGVAGYLEITTTNSGVGVVIASGAPLDIITNGQNQIYMYAAISGSNGLVYGTTANTSALGQFLVGEGVPAGLVLNAADTFTGGITVNSGTLQLDSAGSINSSNTLTVNTGGAFQLGNVNAAAATVAGIYGTGVVEAGTTNIGTFTVNVASGTDTFNGTIGGGNNATNVTGANNLALTVSGGGTLILTGTNTYTDGTIIGTNSTLELGGSGVLGAGVGGGGYYASTISTTNGALFVDASSANQTLSGIISGVGGVTESGTSTLVLTATETYTGATTVTGGTLQIGDGSSGALSNSSLATVSSGGTLAFDQINGSTYSGTIADTGTVMGLENSGASNTLSGVISGAGGGFTQAGLGTTLLTGNDTYTGPTLVNAGTLQIGNGSAGTINSSTNVTVAGGTLAFDEANGSAFATAINDLSGTVAGAESTATVTNTLSGNISGGGGFTQSGVGTTILTGSNSYLGATTITAGTLQIGNGVNGSIGATASTLSSGTKLVFDEANGGSYNGNITNNAGTVIGAEISGNTNTLSGIISGNGGFTQSGLGTTLLSGANTYTGATTIDAGEIQITSVAAAGAAQSLGEGTNVTLSGVNSTTSNAILDYTGAGGTFGQNITVTTLDDGVIDNSGGGVLDLTGKISKNGSVLTLEGGEFVVSGVISGSSNNSDLNLTAASVALTTNNSYSGPTRITDGSYLLTTTNNALPTAPASAITLGTNTDNEVTNTLDLAGTSETVASLNVGSTSTNVINQVISSASTGYGTNLTLSTSNSYTTGTLTVNDTTTNTADNFSGSLGGSGSATNFGLTKTGAGTLVLSGVNTYTGATTINGGGIDVTGSLSAASAVSVNSSGTLSGSGSVGNITLNAGGTVAPGGAFALGENLSSSNTVNNVLSGTSLTITGGTLSYNLYSATPNTGTSINPAGSTLIDLGSGKLVPRHFQWN